MRASNPESDAGSIAVPRSFLAATNLESGGLLDRARSQLCTITDFTRDVMEVASCVADFYQRRRFFAEQQDVQRETSRGAIRHKRFPGAQRPRAARKRSG